MERIFTIFAFMAMLLLSAQSFSLTRTIDAGGYHTCSMTDLGVKCWGWNNWSQSSVPKLTNPREIHVKAHQSCALDANGVTCWGLNTSGEISPPYISGDIKQLSQGTQHNCVLSANNSGSDQVTCWGNNDYGQSSVPPLNNPISVAAGSFHTCALDKKNTGENEVVCWGQNTYGQTDVPNDLLDVESLADGGGYHACAIENTGKIICWGRNNYGQLNAPNDFLFPDSVVLDGDHGCAQKGSEVTCWGRNDYGQTNVPQLKNVKQVSLGYSHTCADTLAGKVCWGRNNQGQTTLPDSVATRNHLQTGPTAVCVAGNNNAECFTESHFLAGWAPQSSIDQFSVSFQHGCYLQDTQVGCWGSYFEGYIPYLNQPHIVQAGFTKTCGVDVNGITCWLKNKVWEDSIPETTNVTDLSVAGAYGCAIDNGQIKCFGGGLTPSDEGIPQLENPLQLAGGYHASCALNKETVKCWGDRYVSDDILNVPELKHPTALAMSQDTACALDDTGVICWGSKSTEFRASFESPSAISVLLGYSACVIDDGELKCWGEGFDEFVKPQFPSSYHFY